MKVFIEEISNEEHCALAIAFDENSLFMNQVIDLLDFVIEQKTLDCFISHEFANKLTDIDSINLGKYVQSPRLKLINFQKKSNTNYFQWIYASSLNIGEGDAFNETLCQITDYQIDFEEKCILISLVNANSLNPYFVIRDKMPYQTNFTTILRCNKLDDFKNWFNQKRLFNREYTKHGVNGKGNEPNESKLLCSFEEAQSLLDEAFVDSVSKHLFYFDAKNESFIIFKNEGRGSWYHGYHVTPEDEKVQIFNKISTDTATKLKNLQKKNKK